MAKFQIKDVFYPKFFSVLKKGYTKKQFTKDLFSGIIVGIVALPLAIAFAVASGVSPDKGIVTAIIAGFLISFLGGSRVQIGGPTGAFVIIISGIVAQYGLDGLMISTILAGIFMIMFGNRQFYIFKIHISWFSKIFSWNDTTFPSRSSIKESE